MRARDTRLPPSRCPFCDARLDRAFSPDDAVPSPGDLSVCISCASLLVFGDDLRLQPLTAAQFAELDSELQDAVRKQ